MAALYEVDNEPPGYLKASNIPRIHYQNFRETQVIKGGSVYDEEISISKTPQLTPELSRPSSKLPHICNTAMSELQGGRSACSEEKFGELAFINVIAITVGELNEACKKLQSSPSSGSSRIAFQILTLKERQKIFEIQGEQGEDKENNRTTMNKGKTKRTRRRQGEQWDDKENKGNTMITRRKLEDQGERKEEE
ncbi:hypothetical protein ANN_25056 [Periplaneta americana]|uniref:Uncharacterized protein n=1 Tax=Periplaneta americana TaxID=6978 RepID=A0ABQ8S0C7_PERAM|nr:hypothetical protein ANN_25056 [Periplaneta americana]